MSLKNWPNEWGNRVGIIGVPFAQRVNGNWFIKVYYLDLDQKDGEVKSCFLPMESAPYITLGVEMVGDFKKRGRTSGKSKNFFIKNLSQGDIVTLDVLNKEIYEFKLPQQFYKDSYFYKINIQGEIYVIFCFELLRKLFVNHSYIVPYLMNPQEMHLLIDDHKFEKDQSGEKLTLYFNKEVPVKTLSDVFIMQFALVYFHPQLRNLWENTLKSQFQQENKNHFHFLPSYFENLNLTCRIRRINEINLVYEIKEIRGIEIPFKEIVALHPDLKEKQTSNNGAQFIEKEGSHTGIVDYADLGYNPSREPKIDFADQFSFIFDKKIKIDRVKKKNNSTETKSKQHININPVNDSHLALNNPVADSEINLLNIETVKIKHSIDYEQIPSGLIEFAKTISKIVDILDVEFTYTFIDLPGTWKNTNTENHTCKLMIVTLDMNPSIYILEVDPSGGKSFSTLLMRSEEIINFTEIADSISKGGYKWPIETLKKKGINYTKQKHAYIFTKREFKTESDKLNYKINKHASNITAAIKLKW